MEQMLTDFIDMHPEYKKKKFSRDEIRLAADLIGSRDTDSDEEVLRRALDARLDVRGVAENIPVTDKEDRVTGVAHSIGEAIRMHQKDNETRDVI